MHVVDMAGQRFWLLQVVRRLPIRHDLSSTEARWECICDCGKRTEVAGSKLRTGRTKSCGCFSHNAIGDRNRTHGLSSGVSEVEYNAYRAMIRLNGKTMTMAQWARELDINPQTVATYQWVGC